MKRQEAIETFGHHFWVKNKGSKQYKIIERITPLSEKGSHNMSVLGSNAKFASLEEALDATSQQNFREIHNALKMVKENLACLNSEEGRLTSFKRGLASAFNFATGLVHKALSEPGAPAPEKRVIDLDQRRTIMQEHLAMLESLAKNLPKPEIIMLPDELNIPKPLPIGTKITIVDRSALGKPEKIKDALRENISIASYVLEIPHRWSEENPARVTYVCGKGAWRHGDGWDDITFEHREIIEEAKSFRMRPHHLVGFLDPQDARQYVAKRVQEMQKALAILTPLFS